MHPASVRLRLQGDAHVVELGTARAPLEAVPALEAELALGGAGDPGVIVLFCHAERDAVFPLLDRLGATPVDAAAVGTGLAATRRPARRSAVSS